MRMRGWFVLPVVVAVAVALSQGAWAAAARPLPAGIPAGAPVKSVKRTDADWKKVLSPQQYRVLREKGTDPAFTGKYVQVKGRGVFRCAGCGLELFRTEQKFESGTGWPSFWAPFAATHVLQGADTARGMQLDELLCARCGGHLGHVFGDGPAPTGLRYCINSSSLTYVPSR